MVGLAAFLRVQPRIWRFEPFLEGIAGVKWFETVSRGETYSPLFGEVSSSTASFSEAVSVLGYGAGINFRWTPLDNEEYGVGQVHVGYRYLSGGDASYPKPAANGYALTRSSTDLIVLTVAFMVRFGPRSFEPKGTPSTPRQ
jgi:hypothetical protein